jgi:hypothetical protein
LWSCSTYCYAQERRLVIDFFKVKILLLLPE